MVRKGMKGAKLSGPSTSTTQTNTPSPQQDAAIAAREKLLKNALMGLGSMWTSKGASNPHQAFQNAWLQQTNPSALQPMPPAQPPSTPPPSQPQQPPSGQGQLPPWQQPGQGEPSFP